jgi:hypothetical protein
MTDNTGFCVITDRYHQLAAESRAACKRPGKFEGCAPYVSYFWAIGLEGCADRDDGETYGFDVTNEDRALFPELKGRRTVRLMERGDGFVVEV